jgi:hypothetical protein
MSFGCDRSPELPGRGGHPGVSTETLTLHQPELSSAIIIFDESQVKQAPEGQALALSPDTVLPNTQAGDIAVNAGACGALLGLLEVPVEA